ncbi:MAG TPA: polyhydroxyalkanoate synthesis regulator DNA-binding domain-containing protein [Candidatus Binatia bacterium]|jgi:polyhydroxyalkanoate synthesis repressor PhaR|nr:polyhydroxyalkanoate synthesis regulator DNA-binding domain-containing protein [Candidatus Binatia bacterium]
MPVTSEAHAKKLEIKKYPNRRYYDATHSRHLTLDEIQSLVQQGYDLRVTDARTSRDITAQVLTQIILELDTPKLDSLPVPLLVRIIRMNDQLVKDFIEKYFNQALKSFLDYQQQIEEQIRRTHGLPSMFPSMSAWTKAMLEPFASAFSGQTSESSGTGTPGQPPGNPVELQRLVSDLQDQIAELKRNRAPKKTAWKRRKGAA